MAQATKEVKARYRENHREELRVKGRAYKKLRYASDPAFREKEKAYTRARYVADPEYFKAKSREKYAADPEPAKAYAAKANRKRRIEDYGLDEATLDRMYVAQNRACAICKHPAPLRGGSKVRALHIDHDHDTGDVRGLLCARCNIGIGFFKDDPSRLASAISYLEGNRWQS